MKSVLLNAVPRVLGRRAGAKALRTAGRIPAVIYGRQAQAQSLEVNAKEMEDLIHHSVSENLLVDLAVKDDARPKRLALVQEVQHHPLTGKVLHVDFHEVAENEKVTVLVPVETVGEAEGVKTDGGVLEHVLFKVKVRGLPKDLPEQLTVDVSHLKIGQAIHLGEIQPLPTANSSGDKQIPVIAVAAPRTEEEELAEAAAAAEAVPGEVEMIKEKKEEGEEGAAPAAKGAEKGAAKGAEKAPGQGRGEGRSWRGEGRSGRRREGCPGGREESCAGGREEEIVWVAAPAVAGRPHRPPAWRTCISSWAWAIPARIMRGPGTMRVSWWPTGWPNAGGRVGLTRRSSTPGWLPRSGTSRRVLLCEPQTYMNSSGEAVGAVVAFYRVPLAGLLVVVDDADLPLGEIRLRPGGSSGGHHGLESIEQHLGTREYARLRIGIGRQSGAREITGYVLGRFSSTEAALVDRVLTVASDQAETWLEAGIQKAMSQFNGVVSDSANEGKEQ